MKILLISDVHGDQKRLEAVHDYHLNAGDLCLNEKQFDSGKMIIVKGNNDFFMDAPYFRVFEIDGVKIMLTHGHHEGVKRGLTALVEKAKQHHVQFCIFGHTHERFLKNIEGITFVNPGALGDYEHSYAIYENGKIDFFQEV